MSRRLDLSKFNGSDSESEDAAPSKRGLELNALKSKTFSLGITKKSKKDLEREAEERKRIEEEKAAALVYAEYAEAFEGPSSEHAPLGGTRGASNFGRRPAGPGGGFVRAGGAAGPAGPTGMGMAYEPPKGPAGPPKGPAAMGFGRQFRPPPPRAPSPPPSAAPKGKGKRAMDSFLEEIKYNQQSREQRLGKIAKQEGSSVSALAAWESEKGSHVVGDQETTNLFISNLPSNITEESLGMFFAKLGPVGTTKIMWPRGDEDTSVGASITTTRRFKAGLSGFVSYMKRRDAERAVKELDGMDWGGSILRVGWSKPVPMPPVARYELPAVRDKRARSPSPPRRRDRDVNDPRRGRSRSRSRSESRSRSRSPAKQRKRSVSRSRAHSPSSSSSSRSPPPSRRKRSRSYSSYSSDSASSRSRSRSRSYSPLPRPSKKLSAKDKWLATVPEEQRKFIKTVAGRVREHGKGFEDLLKKKEKENAKFSFFFNEDLPDYHLYHQSVDSRYRVPTPPPDDFDDQGYASLYSSDSAEDSEKERTVKGKLGKLARKRFEAMLRCMSGKRVEIARGMEFAVLRAEAADEVAEVICQSLRLDATPVPRKMARLHLISDILHNSASSLPNVWRYRQAFEKRLPPVFAHLSTVYQSLLAYSGKISADVFRAQVAAVLDIWERWIVFNTESAEYLRGLLDGTKVLIAETKATDQTKEEAQKQKPEGAPSSYPPAANSSNVAPGEDADGMKGFKSSGFKKSAFKPIDALSAPVVPAAAPAVMSSQSTVEVDIDGEAMEMDDDDDLDGEAMEEDEDLDGEAM